MFQKTTFLTVSILSLGSLVAGQTGAGKSEKAEAATISQRGAAVKPSPNPMPKQIMGGVLNGKAISLPKPTYSAAARAVGASGAVSVQVLIDEEGNVASATAVSGHPILRAASVEAARLAKFSPTLLEGQPVKVSGIITYNYVPPFSVMSLGFELAYAESEGSFREYIFAKSLASQLPEEWLQEKQVLQELSFEPPPTLPVVEKPKPVDAGTDSVSTNKFTVMGNSTGSASGSNQTGKLTAESIAKVREMRTGLNGRLAADIPQQWGFNVGTALGKFAAEIEDENSTRLNTETLAQLAENSPLANTSQFLLRFKQFIALIRTSNLDPEKRPYLVQGATALKGIKF